MTILNGLSLEPIKCGLGIAAAYTMDQWLVAPNRRNTQADRRRTANHDLTIELVNHRLEDREFGSSLVRRCALGNYRRVGDEFAHILDEQSS